MKRLILILFSITLIINSFAQLNEDWTDVTLEGLLKFSYPNNRLEVQDEALKRIVDIVKQNMIVKAPPSRFTLQQKGLNEGKSTDKYVRVMVETFSGKTGSFIQSDLKSEKLTIKEIESIKKLYKDNIDVNLKSNGVIIEKWFPVEVKNINNSFCVILKYIRKSTVAKGNVIVNLYCFPDNDLEVDFTLACRETEHSSWTNDFFKIINSIKVIRTKNK